VFVSPESLVDSGTGCGFGFGSVPTDGAVEVPNEKANFCGGGKAGLSLLEGNDDGFEVAVVVAVVDGVVFPNENDSVGLESEVWDDDFKNAKGLGLEVSLADAGTGAAAGAGAGAAPVGITLVVVLTKPLVELGKPALFASPF
jgi:hypothetical protein